MTGTVIRVLSDSNGTSFVYVDRTSAGPVDPTITPIRLDAREEPFATYLGNARSPTREQMLQVGSAMLQALRTNQFVSNVLDSVLMQAPRDEPIYVYLDAATSDVFPWEVLCYPGIGGDGFLALNPHWPIGRIVGRPSSAGRKLPFAPPLRMLAVLAAAGVSARSEWLAIRGALQASALDVELLVLVCEKSLKDEIDATPGLRVKTQYVLDGVRVREALSGFRPNLLHFFCHGQGGEKPQLQLATRVDFDARAPLGSVLIQPTDLKEIGELRNSLWLLTLNCCNLAKAEAAAAPGDPPPAGDAAPADPGVAPAVPAPAPAPAPSPQSFARSLVALWEFPAVVAMRERVEASVASQFSRSFYSSVFRRLKGLLAVGNAPVSLEWVQMLTEPRSDLERESQPWSLPVLYVRPEDVQIEPARVDLAAVLTQLKLLRDYRNEVGNILPPDKLEALNTRIRELELQLAS